MAREAVMAEEKAVMAGVGEELAKATVQEMLEDGPVLQETLAAVDVPTILLKLRSDFDSLLISLVGN